MTRYKRYLLGEETVPKTTRYRHKKCPPRFQRQPRTDARDKVKTVSMQQHLRDNLTFQPCQPSEPCEAGPSSSRESDFLPRSVSESDESISDFIDAFPEITCDSIVVENECRVEGEVISNLQDDPVINDILRTKYVQFSVELESVEGSTSKELCESSKEDDKEYLSETLCPCTDATAGDVLLQCLTLGLRHNFSWVAQVDILKMVNCIYSREVVPDTKYKYLQHVQRGKTMYHIFCPQCELYLGRKDELEETVKCACGTQVETLKTTSFFLSADLECQVKELLGNPDVVQSLLTYRFERKKVDENAYEDIYDGAEYQKHFKNRGILSNPYNFSYCFNTDGIPMGKSSNKTVWPIYITLNELCPRERGKYVLLAGLYVGCKDPNQKAFLEPFVEQANRLSTSGFNWLHNGKEVNSKLIPLCCVVDSVARYQMLNMSAFNGKNGCTFCYQKTERSTRGPRYSVTGPPVLLRTAESTHLDVLGTMQDTTDKSVQGQRKKKKDTSKVVRGVKGPSILMLLQYFSLIGGFVPDYMHSLLLGVIRTHTELILDSTRKKFWVDMEDNFGIEHLITTIDSRLTKLKPPKSITRTPRTLKDWKIWKASEWRSWLIFYSIPCLHGLLKNKHLEHLAMLSMACNIILQKSITEDGIRFAHNLFIKYACLFQEYFGIEEMVYNIHLLTHVCQSIKSFGPAWTHNAFVYEGQNRYLLQMYQSPTHVALQILKKFLTFSALPSLCKQLSVNDRILRFCDKVLDSKKLRYYVRCNGIMLLGSGKKYILSDEENDILQVNNGFCTEVVRFDKMLYGRVRYTTYEYSCLHKNNDAFVFLKYGRAVRIDNILKSITGDVIILVREIFIDRTFKINRDGFEITHIQKVLKFGNLNVISAEDIAAHSVFLQVHNENYICKMPYGCYGD